MGQDGGGRSGVSQRIVRRCEVDAVALGNINEAVRHLTVGVKATRHAQRAELGTEFEACAAVRCANNKPRIELSIVGCEDRTIEQGRQLVERCREPGSTPEHWAGDAVDVRWSDTLEGPPQPDEGGPLIEDRSVSLDDDGAELEDAVASVREN